MHVDGVLNNAILSGVAKCDDGLARCLGLEAKALRRPCGNERTHEGRIEEPEGTGRNGGRADVLPGSNCLERDLELLADPH